MAILNAETLALLSGTSWNLTGIETNGILGTPTKAQRFDFGGITTMSGVISIVADQEVNDVDFFGGRFTATISATFELLNLKNVYLTAQQRISTLDLAGSTLKIAYSNHVETYTKII